MAKGTNQKLKLLYLAEILQKETDETHPITIAQMIARLHALDIAAERKSVYDDLAELRKFGYDIISVANGRGGYYLASGKFESAELKLLADAAASSKFITEKKTMELIDKLTTLTSVHNARSIKRQLYVIGRPKNINEKIYYCVDTLHRAIHDRVQIRFLYFHYDARKRKIYTNGGAFRTVSPYAMCWDDENYYLVAYNPVRQKIVHFRVDRMENVELLQDKITPMPPEFNITEYISRQFGMFAGEEKCVSMRFENSLAEVVLDRFGKDVMMVPSGENHFIMTADIHVGPPFYGWIFQFGSHAVILEPSDVREAFLQQLTDLGQVYADSQGVH